MPATHIICTLFDHRYLSRGLVMIESARSQGWSDDIWVLCLSPQCERALAALALDKVHPLPLTALEQHIPALLNAKEDRSPVEYYFTCMAALHRFLFDTLPQVECTMYVDADIRFFASPARVFEAIGDAPVAITPHNFPDLIRDGLTKFGLYNAGWSAFGRSPEGQACLNWWLARSLEWCLDNVEGDRYANQGYLMRFQDIAPNTRILTQKGFNCAPWNIGGYHVHRQDGHLKVDDDPLVFFHFHGVKLHYHYFYFDSHRDYRAPKSRLVRNEIYKPYVRELLAQERRAASVLDLNATAPLARGELSQKLPPLAAFTAWGRERKVRMARIAKHMLDLLEGRPILAWRGRVH